MPTTDTWCLRDRRGTSTTLGTLIFVGILFTAVIPMFLVMRQADTLYEKRKFELGRLDDERRREDIYVYVFPTLGQYSTNLSVAVQNKGALGARIVRLWINDTFHELDCFLQPMSEGGLGSFNVTPKLGSSYFVTVTTYLGNVVAFDTPLNWSMDDGWVTNVLSVNVLISSLPGQEFKVEVTGPSDYSESTHTGKYDPKFFIVKIAGTYAVTVYRGSKPIYYEEVTITWPYGPPVEWVFA